MRLSRQTEPVRDSEICVVIGSSVRPGSIRGTAQRTSRSARRWSRSFVIAGINTGQCRAMRLTLVSNADGVVRRRLVARSLG